MGVLLYFGKSSFWALWVVSIQFEFPMREDIFMYTIIHNYSMEGYTPIFISSFMWFSLFSSLYFSCVCFVRILSSKIYFLCFLLASLHIALIYYFYIHTYCLNSKTNLSVDNIKRKQHQQNDLNSLFHISKLSFIKA